MQISENLLITFNAAILYLQSHQWVYYTLIFLILCLIANLIMTTPAKKIVKKPAVVISNDLSAIAGDDVIATQLDLAKAYIEMDQPDLARKILKDTLKSGTPKQQQESRQLMMAIL
jgi:FimV-like protein